MEDEYINDEKVLYKTKGKLWLTHKELEEVECFVTEGHVVIESAEPVKIPVPRIKDCSSSFPLSDFSYSARNHQPSLGTTTLTFFDELNKKRKLSLEMTVEDLGYFERAIRLVKQYPEGIPPTDIEKLIESLKIIGVQTELVDSTTVKLTGRNIDEIQLRYGLRQDERMRKGLPGGFTENYLAGLTYIVKLETLQESRELTAETETGESRGLMGDAVGIKWIGGELAFRLNEDTELAYLIMKAGETDMRIKAKKKPQRVEISGGFEDIPKATRESLEVHERIAKHVREVASATVRMPGVSRGEYRVARGSIQRRVISSTLGGAVLGFVLGIIWVAVNAVRKDLDVVDFNVAGILILGFAICFGLYEFLRLAIKRLRGRY
jgi:hypothetical protein